MKKLLLITALSLIAGQNIQAMGRMGAVLVEPESKVTLQAGLYDAEAPTGRYATATGIKIARIGGEGQFGGDLVLEPSMPGKPERKQQNPNVRTQKGINIPTTGDYLVVTKPSGMAYMESGMIPVASVAGQDILLKQHLLG